jgi:hypothetical protein
VPNGAGQRLNLRRRGKIVRDLSLFEIQGGLHANDEIEKLLAKAVDLAGYCAMKLTQGGAPCLIIFGADELGNRLGLGEVETAGEEGALGKLAGAGTPRSGSERRLQDGIKDDASAVALYFNGRFAGVGAALGHVNGKDFVDRFRRVWVDGRAQSEEKRGEVLERAPSPAAENPGGYRESVGAAHADNANTSTRPRRDRRNRVVAGTLHPSSSRSFR